jgi:hypothetical protein
MLIGIKLIDGSRIVGAWGAIRVEVKEALEKPSDHMRIGCIGGV